MSTPHQHAEVIKAWADGITVQERLMRYGEWQEWRDITSPNPTWWTDLCYQFRIKPKPPQVIYAHVKKMTKYSAQIFITCEHNWNEDGKPSYTLPANVKLTFDGETEELKSVEIVK